MLMSRCVMEAPHADLQVAVDKLVNEGLVEWVRGSSTETTDSDDSSDDTSSVASADYEKVPKTVKLTPFGELMSEHVISRFITEVSVGPLTCSSGFKTVRSARELN